MIRVENININPQNKHQYKPRFKATIKDNSFWSYLQTNIPYKYKWKLTKAKENFKNNNPNSTICMEVIHRYSHEKSQEESFLQIVHTINKKIKSVVEEPLYPFWHSKVGIVYRLSNPLEDLYQKVFNFETKFFPKEKRREK